MQLRLGISRIPQQTESLLELRRRSFAAKVAERATYKLNHDRDVSRKHLADSMCPLRDISCKSSKYRTITGTCNNVFSPHDGASMSAFHRMIPPDYDDGISSYRTSVTGKPLPDPKFRGEVTSRVS
ncbi:hypothetical protein COOONC_18832 [Cooperia oncophora]